MEKVVNEAHRSKFQTLEQFYTSEDLLVFDIETTGFTAEHTALYLIGCAYYKNRQIRSGYFRAVSFLCDEL